MRTAFPSGFITSRLLEKNIKCIFVRNKQEVDHEQEMKNADV